MMSKKRSSPSFSSKLGSSYRGKQEDFFKLFKDLPNEERLIYANVMTVTREKSARLIPNALQICTKSEKYFFTSLGSREKIYALIAYIWKKIHSCQCRSYHPIWNFREWAMIGEMSLAVSLAGRMTQFETSLVAIPPHHMKPLGLSQKEIWMSVRHFNGDDVGLTDEEEKRYQTITQLEIEQFLVAVQPQQKSPLLGSRRVGLKMSASFDDADQEKKLTDHGDGSDNAEGNNHNNSLLRRKKKKSVSRSMKGAKHSRSFGSTRSVSMDVPDGAADTNQKRSSGEIGKSVSFDEEMEDQVFGKDQSRPGSRLEEDDDNLSVISENMINEDSVCGLNHEHLSCKIIDEVYSIGIERMFELLFTESPFQEDMAKRRKIFDTTVTPWVDDVEGEYLKSRTRTFNVPINISFCPKRAQSVEKQMMFSTSKPGRRYMIDTETDTHGIPYGDAFTLLNRYCLTRVSSRSCRLIISGHVRYRKNVMALIKNLVYKTCISGMNENFGILNEMLRDEEAKLTGQTRPLTAGSDSGSTPSTPGDRSRPDGALATKGSGDEVDSKFSAQSNGVAGKSHRFSESQSSSLFGNKSVFSAPVSGCLLVICLVFFVLMCVNISLMVILCTMDLPDLSAYSTANLPSHNSQSEKHFDHRTQPVRDSTPTDVHGQESLQNLLSHINSLRNNLKSDLSQYDSLKPSSSQEPNGSCDGGDCGNKDHPGVDPLLKDIISLQSQLHAAHLTRLYNTLSETTNLMRVVQQSLDKMLTSGESNRVPAEKQQINEIH